MLEKAWPLALHFAVRCNNDVPFSPSPSDASFLRRVLPTDNNVFPTWKCHFASGPISVIGNKGLYNLVFT